MQLALLIGKRGAGGVCFVLKIYLHGLLNSEVTEEDLSLIQGLAHKEHHLCWVKEYCFQVNNHSYRTLTFRHCVTCLTFFIYSSQLAKTDALRGQAVCPRLHSKSWRRTRACLPGPKFCVHGTALAEETASRPA